MISKTGIRKAIERSCRKYFLHQLLHEFPVLISIFYPPWFIPMEGLSFKLSLFFLFHRLGGADGWTDHDRNNSHVNTLILLPDTHSLLERSDYQTAWVNNQRLKISQNEVLNICSIYLFSSLQRRNPFNIWSVAVEMTVCCYIRLLFSYVCYVHLNSHSFDGSERSSTNDLFFVSVTSKPIRQQFYHKIQLCTCNQENKKVH